MKTEARGERRFEGLGVSAGIAIGPAHVIDSALANVPEYPVPARSLDAELRRLEAALAVSRAQLEALHGRADALGEDGAGGFASLFEAHLQMLSSGRLVRGTTERVRDERINAEAAVRDTILEVARGFEDLDDPYLAARAADVREVGDRLIRNLTKSQSRHTWELPRDSVILAEEVTPAATAMMDPKRVAGFVSALGGPESHSAIMARSLGLPAVMGVTDAVREVRAGERVIVDGDAGVVVLNPSARSVSRFERRRDELRHEQRLLARLRKTPAVTQDGVRIVLQTNLELPAELKAAHSAGAEGVGLLRTEVIYMNRDELPDEEEQFQLLRQIVEGMDARPVTMRTLDLGGDKLGSSLDKETAVAANPALGLRAIRLSLRHPALLEVQLAAMLRAGHYGPVRILLPMIVTAGEVRQVRSVLARVAARLVARRVPIADPLPPLGVMIEVPGAALAADGIARVADFFAIGTNDLIMYALAIDRGDEAVAYLYNPLHPAVLRLIQLATESALRNRLPVSICGEIAGDPRYTALLLGLGLRELSMVSSQIPRIKRRIRALNLSEAARRARAILDQTDPGRVAALLDDFNALA